MICDSIMLDVDGTMWDECESMAKCRSLAMEENFNSAHIFSKAELINILF